uniref:Kelch domain-containing protein 10 n=1 Tax=Syphacia muris TaxID=451379 RepID=A0A0N5AFL9_9BILA
MYWTVKVDGGPRRVNHASVAIGSDIYSFGGYCSGVVYDGTQPIDVYVLHTDNFRWSRVDVDGEDYNDSSTQLLTAPYQRYGHTVVEYSGKAFLWGGRNDDYGACNKMHAFDPCKRQWSSLNCEGKPPPARDGHSACVNGDMMYVFGGYEESSRRYSSETYAFNFETSRWCQVITTGEPPEWRDFHTSCIIDNSMYVFGGRSDEMVEFQASSEFYCNKLRRLDLRSNIWSEVKVVSEQPSGRRSHTAWTHGGRMYIFGGYLGTTNEHFNDLWEFNPKTLRWKQLFPVGVAPSPRRRHCTIVVNDQVFLFGGTTPVTSKKVDASLSGLSELADLHILDYSPSLKTLSAMAVLKNGLQKPFSYVLPYDLRLIL